MFRLEFSLLGRNVKVEFNKPSDQSDAHMKKNHQRDARETDDKRKNTLVDAPQENVQQYFEGDSQAAQYMRGIRDITNRFYELSGTGQRSKFDPR